MNSMHSKNRPRRYVIGVELVDEPAKMNVIQKFMFERFGYSTLDTTLAFAVLVLASFLALHLFFGWL